MFFYSVFNGGLHIVYGILQHILHIILNIHISPTISIIFKIDVSLSWISILSKVLTKLILKGFSFLLIFILYVYYLGFKNLNIIKVLKYYRFFLPFSKLFSLLMLMDNEFIRIMTEIYSRMISTILRWRSCHYNVFITFFS